MDETKNTSGKEQMQNGTNEVDEIGIDKLPETEIEIDQQNEEKDIETTELLEMPNGVMSRTGVWNSHSN